MTTTPEQRTKLKAAAEAGAETPMSDHIASIMAKLAKLREALEETRHLINTRAAHRALPIIDAALLSEKGDEVARRALQDGGHADDI